MKYIPFFLFSFLVFSQTNLEPAPIQSTSIEPHKDQRFGIDDMANSGMDGFEFIGGYGEGTDNYRFASSWQFLDTTLADGKWIFTGNITANFSAFEGRDSETHERVKLRDAGVTPVWTFKPTRYQDRVFKPFIEFGVGLHHLSKKDLPTKDFSTNFQFGDHIGFGATFGPADRYRLTYQFQHLSNGGIDSPNPGINFHLVSMGFKLKK